MPRKLGQHFLKDKRALRKIAVTLEINSRDTVVEIGPGHGELTEFLLEAGPKKIIAIEKDGKLVKFLKEESRLSPLTRYSGSKGMSVVEGDILELLQGITHKLGFQDWKLTGNIPYYITGHLLRKIGELAHSTDAQGKRKMPKLIVFTIQREVAERICAKSPKMNLLAASVQFWGKPKIVGYISKKSFRPPPKVDSAIIKIVPSPQTSDRWSGGMGPRGTTGAGGYYRFIKILFKQPRKTVLNNLRTGFRIPQGELVKKLERLGVNPNSRPQNLTSAQIKQLSRVFTRLKSYN